jgi:hypothetical protein
MRARHAAQKAAAEAAHADDSSRHNQLWDAKAAEYEAMVQAQLDKLAAAASAREAELTLELAQRAPRRLQPSKELLALRSKQEALGRQGKYTDAAAVQKAADRLEAAEVAAARDAHAAESSRARASAAAKAATEREALLQRAARGRDQMYKARRGDAEKLLQRYRNVLAALENVHKREAVQLEHFLSAKHASGQRGAGTPVGASPSSGRATGDPAGVANTQGSGGRGRAVQNGNGNGAVVSPFSKATTGGGVRSPGVLTGVANMRAAAARKSAGSLARAAAAGAK